MLVEVVTDADAEADVTAESEAVTPVVGCCECVPLVDVLVEWSETDSDVGINNVPAEVELATVPGAVAEPTMVGGHGSNSPKLARE